MTPFYAINDHKAKAFLITVAVRNDVAGCDIPVAFIITNSENQWPLAEALTWLKPILELP